MARIANKIKGILKCKNVGKQVSFIWLCCPSALSPDVGPKVVSETGEPASPKAAAAARINIETVGENPSFIHKGTNKTANIGIVPKEVPIPIDMNNPVNNIKDTAINLLFCIKGKSELINVSIPYV